jgi:hypothetical protein
VATRKQIPNVAIAIAGRNRNQKLPIIAVSSLALRLES